MLLPTIEESRALIEKTPPGHADTPAHAARLNNLAVALQTRDLLEEADDHYKQSRLILERELGTSDPAVAMSLCNRASLCRLLGVHNEAERLQQEALRIWCGSGFPTDEEMSHFTIQGEPAFWAERVDSAGNPIGYRKRVENLRQRVEKGIAEARDELVDHIRELGPWYHNINIAGIDTNHADPDYPARRWRHFEPSVPDDLSGETVLDIGCDAGFFSLEMKRRNADRVVAIDIMAYRLAQVRFVSNWFELPIEPRELSVYDLKQLGTRFDRVIFPGVLYHLKHPLYALEQVAEACRGTLYFQSAMRGTEDDFTPDDDYPASEWEVFERPEYPKLFFVEKSLNGDESNWWLANRSCLKAMLRVSGFDRISSTSAPDHFVCTK
jgi:tRNA (mo5U34)-methyltransferase